MNLEVELSDSNPHSYNDNVEVKGDLSPPKSVDFLKIKLI